MEPTLSDGDIVLLRRKSLKPEHIIVVDHPRLGRIIKRLGHEGQLSGDNANSTPTDRLGSIQDCKLVGVAILAITPRGWNRL